MKTRESGNLAERLRELYQVYGCEDELPAHEDLVSKLDGLRKKDRNYFQEALNRGVGSQISYEKALQVSKQRSKFNYGEILGEAIYGTVCLTARGNFEGVAELLLFETPAMLKEETDESLKSDSERAEQYLQSYNRSARTDFEHYIRDELNRTFTRSSERKRKKRK